ncbi:MAG TPA: penicillin-binding protein 2 [Solirubrobacterales bacterium]|nr:penicillin-binding protein 2 [Solirubrobacterales bacterium]
MRFAVVTGLVIAIVAVLLLRVWSLQVLSGEQYRALAEDNRIREIRLHPPRGEILDREGRVLVDNRSVVTLVLRPAELPKDPSARKRELVELADLLGLSYEEIRTRLRLDLPSQFGGEPIVLKEGLRRPLLFYLLEHQQRFPGVSVERAYVRRYRAGSLAAHVLGTVGEVSPGQLKGSRSGALEPGDVVGQSGVEQSYDRQLRGAAGELKVQVDALGRPKGELGNVPAGAGSNLRLSLDADLQATGEEALSETGKPSAFVAMNARTGAVLAMGSYPTFDLELYAKPRTPAEYRALAEDPDAPLLNRADQGGYPTGSSFKPLVATAALEEGLVAPDEIVYDGGSLTVGGVTFQNAGGAVNGSIDMRTALQVSSDVYFYRLGAEADAEGEHGDIQDWARSLGIGRQTGIDLPDEGAGLLPTPAWRDRLYRSEDNPYIDRPWTTGDNVNLSVGQGDLQVTPLQLATAYAAIANGGAVVTPHLGARIEGPGGRTVSRIRPPPRRRLPISDLTRGTVLEGMERAAMEPGGTSYPVFGGFPFAVAGKTGTAERGEGAEDQSWYGAIAPAGEPRIVVVATVEGGGFGVEAAAPVAARILERAFELEREAE